MNKGKYVFAQVLSLVNRYEFQKCVDRYNGDHRTRGLNCWSQFAHMFYGQLTGRNGLRDTCLCLGAHESRLYHSGIKRSVDHSTLARANENRDWRIYADFGSYLIGLVKPLYTDNHGSLSDIDRDVFVLDSTTISVSYILMDWAHGKYSRGAVKMHTLLDLRSGTRIVIMTGYDSIASSLVAFTRGDGMYVTHSDGAVTTADPTGEGRPMSPAPVSSCRTKA